MTSHLEKQSCILVLLVVGSIVGMMLSPSSAYADDPPVFITKWDSNGSDKGQFNQPQDIAVDGAGDVYVVDSGNQRIQKFDMDGNFLLTWGFGVATGTAVFEICTAAMAYCQAGIFGNSNGQFKNPSGVAVDSANQVYITDSTNSRVQKFDSNGNFLMTWGVSGSGNGQFGFPIGVATDSADNIYIADAKPNHRVQKFDSNGNFLMAWGSPGSGNGQFDAPRGIAVDREDNIYVVDTNNHRVQKFDSLLTLYLLLRKEGVAASVVLLLTIWLLALSLRGRSI